MKTLSVTSNNAPSRFDSVSSGPNMRKFFEFSFSFMTSRRNFPNMRVASATSVPARCTFTA